MSNTAAIPARSVDIRRLWHADMPAFRDHLLRLDFRSRQQRFGGGMSNDFIADYAVSCFGQGDLVFGAFVDGRLRGAGELRSKEAIWSEQAPFHRHIHAEAAFSVEDDFRRRGIGEQSWGRDDRNRLPARQRRDDASGLEVQDPLHVRGKSVHRPADRAAADAVFPDARGLPRYRGLHEFGVRLTPARPRQDRLIPRVRPSAAARSRSGGAGPHALGRRAVRPAARPSST